MIETARLRLVPATLNLARAELHDRAAFAQMLGARVPDGWPPDTLADALPLFLRELEQSAQDAGWLSWYALAREAVAGGWVLVASGGFHGAPREGMAEIGYSVLPEFQGRGYATEMVRALTEWALAQPDVIRIAAETEWANPASVRVLAKAGFVAAGPPAQDAGPGGVWFEYIQGGRSDGI